MAIAENAAERLTYKFYADGAITAGAEPDPTTAPGATGGQILRHVTQNLSLAKDVYRANEKRSDRQRPMGRHGTRRAPGTINGLLSPHTYADHFEAAFRGTWAAGASLTEAELTSVAADSTTSKFIFGAGDPVALGLGVGKILRFTDLSEAANNAKNFLILGFGGTSNRDVTVFPAPTTMAADTTFTVATAGKSLIIPATGHVSRKVAYEVYNSDVDIARLFTEARVGGFNLGLPPNDNAQVSFNVLGRNRRVYSAGSAPFFTDPAAETTTDFCAAVNGLLRVNGQTLGVVTGLNLSLDMAPNGPPVAGTNLVPEIFLGDAAVSGDFSVFLEDADLLDAFDDEDEIELLSYLTTNEDDAAPAIVAYLPRIKLGSNDESDDGSGGKVIRCAFEAGRYVGAGAGIPSTTIQLVDTEVT